MIATPELTERYHARHAGLHTTLLGRTGLRVSGAGFGGYRIASGVEAHRMALRRALASGINLIDTSANYADGASEELIGQVIAEMVADGLLSRGEIVVVSKGGYIQGSNHAMALERVQAGSGFPDVVDYAPDLWHCIAPEFLQDQITRSLGRLGLPALDVYLLHNPEYYLGWAAREGIGIGDARTEYYRRIRDAFAYLETEVERGRIGCYGISSNSFPHPPSSPDFTSLDECVRIAERISLIHSFKVIQFPANLIERGFVTERNQPGERTLMELAREKNLGVLINRPLNAITGGELIRLADFPIAGVPAGKEHIAAGIGRLMEREEEFRTTHAPAFAEDEEGSRALLEFVSVGAIMEKNWDAFGSIEHFNTVLSQHFAPRLGFVAQYLREHGTQHHVDWYASYMADARALLQAVGAHYGRAAQERAELIRERLASALGVAQDGHLSALAVRMLLGVEGVDSVLVGMRREEYVDDVLGALGAGPIGDEEGWGKLNLEGVVSGGA
jgi:aryl-alcohol dehydrogenase-like predicted oxidoreductase